MLARLICFPDRSLVTTKSATVFDGIMGYLAWSLVEVHGNSTERLVLTGNIAGVA
jgi:hypothetical protein